MSRKTLIGVMIVLLLLGGLGLASGGSVWSQPAQEDALLSGYTFTGYVYEGYKPSTSTPLSGVTVGLWGDQDEWPEGGSFTRVQLATTTTNSSGAFTLNWTPSGTTYLYFHIMETDPTGYFSTGAQAGSPGYVKNYNCVSYYVRGIDQNTTYSGNGFWDARAATATPTRTTVPRYTPTFTATRPPAATPTITATSTRPTGPTPTATATSREPIPTATATATTGCPPLSLTIEKRLVSHPNNQAAIGDTLTFVITVTNTSGTAVPAINVRDTFPCAYFELVAGQTGFSGSGNAPPDCWVEWTSYGPGGSGFGPGQSFTAALQLRAIAFASATEAVNVVEGWLAPYDPCQGPSASARVGVEIGCPPLSLRLEKRLVSHPSGTAFVGDTLTFVITLTNTSGTGAPAASVEDRFPTAYFDLVPGQSFNGWAILPTEQYVSWTTYGPGNGGIGPGQSVAFSLLLIAKAPASNTEAVNKAKGTLAPFYPCQGPSASAEAGVTITEPQGDVRVTKTLIDPASGAGAVGSIARFRLHAVNVGNAPANFNLEDTYGDADFDFVSATPPPTMDASNGIAHLLRWENLTLPPGGALDIFVDLRLKQPGTAVNCAHYATAFGPGFAGIVGPDSCASVRVPAIEDKSFYVMKQFTSPSNHLAKVGDKLSFWTAMKTVGALAIASYSVHDYFTPPSIGNPGDWWLDYTHSDGPPTMFAPGFSSTLSGTTGPTVGTAYPALNIAEWTATWPDGSKQTRTAMDYVYITDQQPADGLAIRKELLAPLGGVAVSNTVTFRITIVNVAGTPLPVTPLADNFDPGCFRFLEAIPSPDGFMTTTAGAALTWNNLGPLLPGQSVFVIARFHAEAPCIATLNCAGTQDVRQNGAIAIDCVPLDIAGPRPVLRINKIRLTPSPAPVGSLVEYRIHLQNAGVVDIPSPLPLTDHYDPAFLDFDSAGPPPSHANPPMGVITWNDVGPLAAGQGKDIIVRLRAIRPGANVRNCAGAVYAVAGVSLPVEDCALVDIFAPGPAVRIAKERVQPAQDVPVAVGEAIIFRITVRNVGGVPLAPLSVEDTFDPGCMSVVSSDIPPTIALPGHLLWNLPPLPPGGVISWQVYFLANNPCGGIANCVYVKGLGPDGAITEDAACAPARIAPPEPGVTVKKYVKLFALPQVGDVIQFRIQVENSGNTTLVSAPLGDRFDPTAFDYVSALPAPDMVNPATGEVVWGNLGPLNPGDTRNVSIFLRAKGGCLEIENCAGTRAVDLYGRQVESGDCAGFYIGGVCPHPIYLPLVLKLFPR